MEISEFTLLAARVIILALMYLLVVVLIFALRADARALRTPQQQKEQPCTKTPSRRRESIPDPTLAPPAQVRLTVTAGASPTTGREYLLTGPLSIGRSTSCAVCIPDSFVSTHHARITNTQGRWVIEDLGSTNGTFVNGNAITTAQPLTTGDTLTIGNTEFRIN
jgi:pSer/pThr/pTyr-binding forkhead associated (FHA) protein